MATNCEEKLNSIDLSLKNPETGQGFGAMYVWHIEHIFLAQKNAVDSLLVEQKLTNKILNHLSLKLTGTEVS